MGDFYGTGIEIWAGSGGGLLPPTAMVVITFAHYGFKEVVVCLFWRLSDNGDGLG